MAHSLTAAMILYTGLLVHNRTNKWEHPSLKKESSELAAMLGTLIYAGAAGCMVTTTVWVKFLEGKTWDNVAVRCGLILAISIPTAAPSTLGIFAEKEFLPMQLLPMQTG
ncbi:MAG: hypothetical protein GY847_33030 [Proteobacteria bacterium]|nr:hypothetical protein [Pseudomonadota bacterium]